MKKITAITGYYGSGKSTFAANYAIENARKGIKVTVADMDTVNPYFRTADLGELFSNADIQLASPLFAGTNLDVPVLQYNIEGLAAQGRSIIIDMGGDDAGAYPLGRYSTLINSMGSDAELLYVVNFYRCLTKNPAEAADSLHEIENACGIKVSGIINNSNLSIETTADVINSAIPKAQELSQVTGLPIVYTVYPVGIDPSLITATNLFPIRRYIKNLWEPENS